MSPSPFKQAQELFASPQEWQMLKQLEETQDTPFLAVNLRKIEDRYLSLMELFPKAKVYYAIKANPAPEVLRLLNSLGAYFDIASIYELQLVLSLGISANKVSYGNTIKKEKDIDFAYQQGVRIFACDSAEDLERTARKAPGSKIFFRIATDGLGADWPLSRKFGCHQDMAYNLALKAQELGLEPYGVTFHVGSQQRDIGQWDEGISKCKYLFSMLKEDGITLKSINLGGGLPASYLEATPSIELYAKEIRRYLEEDFEDNMPEILLEPGRHLVADAGVIVSEVVSISRKSDFNLTRWVYLDVGKFNGLIETIDELIKYPIFAEHADQSNEHNQVILAGPTCDSMDILYETFKYSLQGPLGSGDKVYIFTTGAYTQSYSAVGFNGFPPLKTYFLDPNHKGE